MTSQALTIALAFSVAFCAFRLYSLLRGVAWLSAHYNDFNREQEKVIRRGGQRYKGAQEEIYEKSGGAFFPFGPRSYRLEKWSRGASTGSSALRFPLRVFRFFWRWYNFVLIFLGAAVVLSVWPPELTSTQNALFIIITSLMIVGTISIAAESLLSFQLLNSWTSYHYFGDVGDYSRKRAVQETKIFVGAALTAYVVAIGATLYVSVRHNGLTKVKSGHDRGWAELLDKLPAVIRVAAQNIAFGADGDPTGGVAELVSWLIILQCIGYVALGLNTLWNISPAGRRNRRLPRRST